MPSSSEIRATLCLFGGLIRLLTSALTASLYRRICHVLKPPGLQIKGVTTFLKPGDVALFGEGFAINPGLGASFAKANRERAEAILKAATSKAEAAGVPCNSSTAVHPVIFEAILAAARDTNCDLIFMASHGRRGLAGLLIGSETQRVLTHSKLPVLVVPGQEALV